MSTAIIERDDTALSINFTAGAIALKDSALESSALIGRVTTGEENETAVKAQVALNDVVRTVEKARKEVKEPVIRFGKQIDEAARKFSQELVDELTRISGLVGDFAALEQAKARAAEAARRAEEERIERERLAEEQKLIARQKAEQEERNREAREAAEAIKQARDADERAIANARKAELDRQNALAKAKSHEALDAVNEHFSRKAADLPVVTPTRTQGQIVKTDWKIEVINAHLLAKCHPTCVNITPRLSDIKELLNLGVDVKGIKAEKITTAGVRSGGAKMIEV